MYILGGSLVATPFWFLYFHFIAYVCLLFSIHRHCHCLHTHTHVPHITLASTYVISPCPLFTSIVMQNTPFRFKHSHCLINNICHPGGKLIFFNQIVVRSLEVLDLKLKKSERISYCWNVSFNRKDCHW